MEEKLSRNAEFANLTDDEIFNIGFKTGVKLGKALGVAEALRWRDFDQELPADGQHIIRKIVAIDEKDMLWKRNPYYTDIFHRDAANFDSEEYKNARMRFNYYWRPIE